MSKIRYTTIGDIKRGKEEGVFAVVLMQADVKSRSEMSEIGRVIGARFAQAKIGLQLDNRIVQYATSNITDIGEDIEKYNGEMACDRRLEFMFVNGIGVSDDEFTEKLETVFQSIVSDYEGIRVRIHYVTTQSIILDRKN